MMESLWLPGLTVLAAGLAVGIWMARRTAASARVYPPGKAGNRRDLELAIADLTARRDQIYAQLRGESGEALGEADRRELELSAARTLRELDEKQALLSSHQGSGKKRKGKKARRAAAEARRETATVEPAPATAPSGGFAARHPLVAGFALGAGMVAVIALLIYWAVRDAQPRPEEPMAAAPGPMAMAGGVSPDEAHAGLEDLPITLRVELESLNERVANDDASFSARRERALFLLGIERYVEAFEDAQALLAADPLDIDGLYVQGVVRLTMGQEDLALELFEQVIRQFPDHVRALVWRGIVLFRRGDRDGAIGSWQRALEVSGGSQPEIEELIRAAREAPDPVAPPPGAAPRIADAPPAAALGAQPAPATVGASEYGVRVTLAADAFPPPGGILFVSLRPAGGGPPVAVKRIDRVSGFPFDLTLGAADSMMGQALPESGIVRVRFDADGSASTRSPDDLEAEVEARQGSAVSLVLGAASPG